MKVYIVTYVPIPNGMAPARRVGCYAAALKQAGIDCEIIIATRTERYGVKPWNTLGHGIFQGVPYRYVHGTPQRESNVIVRKINDYLDERNLIRFLDKNLSEGDVVFGYIGGPKTKIIPKICKVVRKKGAKYVGELCELPFGTGDETPQAIKSRLYFEKNIFPLYDGVISISDTLSEYAKSYGRTDLSIVKVPIMVDFKAYQQAKQSTSGDIDYPYILHAGTLLEQKDGFLSLLKAFAELSRKSSKKYKLIATGKPKGTKHESEIKSIIGKYNLEESVSFTGYISDEELKGYLDNSSFVVLNKLPTQQNKYCFATKLGEYMASGKAVLTTNVGEAMNWLTSGKDCMIVNHSNLNELADAMLYLFENPGRCKELGVEAKETCRKSFSIESNVNCLADFFKKIASNETT